MDPRALQSLGGGPRGAEGLPARAGLHAGQERAGERGRLHPAERGLRAEPAVAAGGRLSLLGSCLEGKPVIPVVRRACRVPLHLSLTCLEAADSRFYPKEAQLLCLPSQCVACPGPALGPHALQRGHLLTLDCVNRGNLPSWKVGTFSTLGVPDPLKEVLEDPEVYKHAVGTVSGARSPASCLRYRGCRITFGIVLILLSSASLFLPLLLGLRERHPAQRFLLITANAFFCPFLMVFSVNALCWFRRFSKRKTRELVRRAGEASLLLAPHSALTGCETRNRPCFVYVLLGDCRRALLGAPEGEALFQEALLPFSPSYTCCLAHARRPHREDAAGAPGHVELGLCFCQFVSLQLKRLGGLGVKPV